MAPLPTKLKAWVTIGYIPSSCGLNSMMAPCAGDRSTAWLPQPPALPRSSCDALLRDRVEDRPDDVERTVDVRADVEDEDPDPPLVGIGDRVVLVLVGDAVEDAKSGAGAAALAFA